MTTLPTRIKMHMRAVGLTAHSLGAEKGERAVSVSKIHAVKLLGLGGQLNLNSSVSTRRNIKL